MEDKYREHIKKNINKLIRLTDYEKLMRACVNFGLLTHVMRDNIENLPQAENMPSEAAKEERHRRLFIKLTKRGPTAYNHIKDILEELKCQSALNLLNEIDNVDDSNYSSIHQLKNTLNAAVPIQSQQQHILPLESTQNEQLDGCHLSKKTNKLELYNKEIPAERQFHVEKSKCIHRDRVLPTYDMKSKNDRGVLFLVNNIEFGSADERRNGAENDSFSMLHLFRELGFKLFLFENLTREQFFDWLDQVLKSEYTRRAECFVMALMTHGNQNPDSSIDFVEFSDGAVVKLPEIMKYFENSKCLNLLHKPKIFIFPFCRGSNTDRINRDRIQTDGLATNSQPIPIFSDMLICRATLSGFKAHRDTDTGSWYIQKFCEVMGNHAHDTSLENILKLTQDATGRLISPTNGIQAGTFDNVSFNKQLFFNPGFYE